MADPDTDLTSFTPSTAPKVNGAKSLSLVPPARSVAPEDDLTGFVPKTSSTEDENKGSALGAATRGFVGSAVPAITGGLPGAAAGFALGEALFPPGGGLVGALAGIGLGFAGASIGAGAVEGVQTWALNKVPKFRDMLGQSEEQKRRDQEEHSVASFLGGTAPWFITMSPFNAGKAITENMTTWERLAANPYTRRLFPASIVGGMQLGQEAVGEDKINWNRVAVATAFGLIFNKQTGIGEKISEFGAKPVRTVFGMPNPAEAVAPTVRAIDEQGIAGASVIKETFDGSQQRSTEAEYDAIKQNAIEQSIIGTRTPQVENQARRMEPELFAERDALIARRNAERSWINSRNEPKPYQFLELEEQRDALQKELDEHVAARNGYDRGPRARQIKAQIRHIEAEHAELTERGEAFKAGEATETPEIAQARKRLLDANQALSDIQPRIRAAYGAAADYTGAPTVEAPPPEVAAPPVEAPPAAGAPVAETAPPKPAVATDEHKAFIAKDWANQLINVGVPPDRAEASGRMMAIKYAANASHFNGAKGTAVDVYKAEAPRIVSGPKGPQIITPPPLPTTNEGWAAWFKAGGKFEPGTKGGVPIAGRVEAAPSKVTPPPLPTTKEEFNAWYAAGGKVEPATKGGVSILDKPPLVEATGIGREAEREVVPPPASNEAGQLGTTTEEIKNNLLKAAFRTGVARVMTPEIEAQIEHTAKQISGEEPLPPIVEVKKKAPRGPAAKDPEHYSLLEFLAKNGGLKKDADMAAIFSGVNPFIPGFGPLFRRGGKSPDRALEAAVEAGYIHDQGRVSGGETQVRTEDLRALMDEEARGNKQYKLGREGPQKKTDTGEQRHRLEEHADATLEAGGIDPKTVTGDLRERMLKIMEKEGVSDAGEAYERAIMEEEHHGAETGELEFEPKGVPGWDVEFPDESWAAPGRGEEAATRGEQPQGAEVGGGAREPGGVDREQAAKADALTERTAAGEQHVLPGTERAGQGEMAQRGANAPLRPGVAQKPTDIGLFGDEKDQLDLTHLSDDDIKDFFQGKGQITKGSVDLSVMPPEMRLTKYWDESTLIHEPAHVWLEQLMRDAQHPEAPQWIKDDAATILKELGVQHPDVLLERTKKGEATKRARDAHEKFARSWERYMYDGIAPSAELEGVFARFKSWLLNIYRTVKDLADNGLVEISPNMRSVFDRMLTEEPQRTVIAPDHPGGPTITQIHEADVKATEPSEAEPALDRVVAERDQYAEEQPPKIKAELEGEAAKQQAERGQGTEPPGEGAAGGSGPGEVVGGGGKPEPIASGGGGGEEPGKVVEGGTNARTEGTTVSGAGERGAGEQRHPLATTAAAGDIPRDRQFIDNPTNIDFTKITSKEDAIKAMVEWAEKYWTGAAEPMGKGQMWNLASAMGKDPATMNFAELESRLDNLLGGLKGAAPKMVAARMMADQVALHVAEMNRRYIASKSPEDLANFTSAVMKQDMIMSALSGGYLSWGRTGSALHDMSGTPWNAKSAKDINRIIKTNTGRTLFQMQQLSKLLAEYDQTHQINKFLGEQGLRPWRMVTELWINGLISGIQTHITYLVGAITLGLQKVGPDTAAAAMVGSLRKALGREGESVRFGEIGAGLRGMGGGIAPALQASAEAARTGRQTLLPGQPENTLFLQPVQGTGYEKPAYLNPEATFHDAMATVFGIARGLQDGVVAGAALQRAGGVPGAPTVGYAPPTRGAIPDIQVRGVTMFPLGEIARFPSRMVTALHSFYYPLNHLAHINQLAYREAVNHPIPGMDFDTQVATFVSKPPEWALEESYKAATELSLLGAGGQWTKNLTRLINTEFFGTKDEKGNTVKGTGLPILKFIDPFIHISSNIINQSIVQRTPLGLLSSSIREQLMSKNNVIADTAAGRMLAGTALSVLFGSLAAQGYVAGSEPRNREDAAIWRQTYQAHSVRVGDYWYAMNRLGPMGMLLSTAADLYDVAHQADEGEFTKAATALAHAVSQNILDESFMRGPSDLIKAITDPARYGDAYLRNFVTSFVPMSIAMQQFARGSDPYAREARTMADALRSKIPGLSQELHPRIGVWGDEVPSREGLGGDVTAIWTQKVNNDPVNIALMQHAMHAAAVERKLRNVELTPVQYEDYARTAGRLAKLGLDRLVTSPMYQNAPPAIQHDLLTESMRQSRQVAEGIMFKRYQSILVDAHTIKNAKREHMQ